MSFWRSQARARIAELTKDLPADATLDQRRKALRGKGWSGGWAQKIWQQEVRAHLALHGDVRSTRRQPAFPDHVHFPFRGEANAQG